MSHAPTQPVLTQPVLAHPQAAPSHEERDGIEAGDALRARVHYLVSQHHAIVVQTQFADAKAAALMTLSGVVALRVPLPMGFRPLELGLSGLLLITILLCLWAIMPRFSGKGLPAQDRFSWLALAGDTSGTWDPVRFAQTGDFEAMLAAMAVSNTGGAMVLRKKFRLIRLAFWCAIGAILLVAASLLRQSGGTTP